MNYQERATPVVGAVLWQRTLDSPRVTSIMPDGCLDLLWDANRLFVAGPDTAARWHPSPAGATYVALRFSAGLGPTVLGVPADKLRDQTLNLEQLWPTREAQVLTEQVELDPAAVLQAWVVERAVRCDLDPFGPRVLAMAKAGTPTMVMAERLCMTTRQLHRRCRQTFGYGSRHLARVMRFRRALEEIRCGAPLAKVAAVCGYADQAHLSREVRALAGTTPATLRGAHYGGGSGANRSTGRPSGSRTTA
ncbi:helix-turn-helix domain-containing protein [Mycobacterium sp.]|uniref:helix-turn-helix domain-containing protein n=1 Tax=Mycobacterium sp. TaxID=1785 RepID=UPI003D0CFBE5